MRMTITGLLVLFFCIAPAQDLFTIESGTIPQGGSATFNIYFRDTSGTLINTVPGLRFGSFLMSFTVPAGLVTGAQFQRAGLLSDLTVFLEQDSSNPAANLLQWSVLLSTFPAFQLDAPLPGELIGTLTLTTAAGTGGQTITLSPNYGGNFAVADGSGGVIEALGDGQLDGSFGDIQITGGGGGPQITNFSVNPNSIAAGESASLSWSVSGADSVTIDQGIGSVSASGTRSVSPSGTTTYRITASAGANSVTATTTLNVVADEVLIDLLEVTPTSIAPGGKATLRWITRNAQLIEFNQGIGVVNPNGTLQVSPGSTTTYTLVASNSSSLRTASVTLTVNLPPVVINSFSVDPLIVEAGTEATLAWNVSNADSVSIQPDIGNVNAIGSVNVSPAETTTYTLTAQNSTTTETATLELVVQPPTSVRINRFDFTPETIIQGDTAILNWNVFDAIRFEITPDLGISNPRPVDSLSVGPFEESTRYTLVASARDGGLAIAETTINVIPLEILSFTAEPETVSQGETSTLVWNVNAESVHLSRTEGDTIIDMGFRTGSGSLVVSPVVDTLYTLVAQSGDKTVQATATISISQEGQLFANVNNLLFNGRDSAQLILSNPGGLPLNWNLVSHPAWLSVSPESGNLGSEPQTLSLSINPALFERGLNQGTLHFEADQGTAVEIPATAGNSYVIFPQIRSGADYDTELIFVNLDQQSLDYRFQAYRQDGSLGTTSQNGTLAPQESVTITVTDADGPISWGEVVVPGRTDAVIRGIANVFSTDGQELFSYNASQVGESQIYVPHLAASQLFVTNGSLINLSQNGDDFSFDLKNNSFDLNFLNPNQQVDFDFRTLMGGTIPPNSWGRLNAGNPATRLAAVETFGRSDQSLRQTVAVGLDAEASQQLIFPHLAADTNIFWTGVVVINPNSQAVDVTFNIFDADGQSVQAPNLPVSIAAGEKATFLVDKNTQQLGVGASWLSVDAAQPVFGYMLFGSYAPDDFFSGFQSMKQAANNLCFPYLDQSTKPGGFTGIALVNPNTAQTSVTFSLLDRAGAVKAQRTEIIAGRQKYVALAATLFPDSIGIGDKIVAHGVATLAGFEIFGSGRTTLGGILAIEYE